MSKYVKHSPRPIKPKSSNDRRETRFGWTPEKGLKALKTLSDLLLAPTSSSRRRG